MQEMNNLTIFFCWFFVSLDQTERSRNVIDNSSDTFLPKIVHFRGHIHIKLKPIIIHNPQTIISSKLESWQN
jgi:hypothetical protein